MQPHGGVRHCCVAQDTEHMRPAKRVRDNRAAAMSVDRPIRPELPARILVAGDDLLAGALANALGAYGFAATHIPLRESEIQRGIAWRPHLVIIDARTLDVASGSQLVDQFHRLGLQICIIDESDDVERSHAFRGAGVSALIDGNGPIDQLFRTINRLFRRSSAEHTDREPSSSSALTPVPGRSQQTRLPHFGDLTERERFVLAELMEGHCAEEIAAATFVSVSTVRSQIKAILQKLGVSSQLAAVALARRAGWLPDDQLTDDIPQRSKSRGSSFV
jgi:two-component system, NarL family, nitrate/nitrite response regulator NarL